MHELSFTTFFKASQQQDLWRCSLWVRGVLVGGLELCCAAVAAGLCPPTHPMSCAGVLASRWELVHGTPSISEALSGNPEHPAPLSLLGTPWALYATEYICYVSGNVQEETETSEWQKLVWGREIEKANAEILHSHGLWPSWQRNGRNLHRQLGCPTPTV